MTLLHLFPIISKSLTIAFSHTPFTLQPNILCFLPHHYHKTEFTEITSNHQVPNRPSLFILYDISEQFNTVDHSPLLENIFPSVLFWFFYHYESSSSSHFLGFLPYLQNTFAPSPCSCRVGGLSHTCDFNSPPYSSDYPNTISSPHSFPKP